MVHVANVEPPRQHTATHVLLVLTAWLLNSVGGKAQVWWASVSVRWKCGSLEAIRVPLTTLQEMLTVESDRCEWPYEDV